MYVRLCLPIITVRVWSPGPMGVRVEHRTARVTLRTARGVTDLLGHEVLESGWRDFVVGVVDLGIGVQPWVIHHSVDEIINHGGDGEDPAESFVERWHI